MHRFEDLKRRYAQALPRKAQEIAQLWAAFRAAPEDAAARGALHQGVHRLSGSAPAYGFDEIGAAAQRADARLSDWSSTPEFARAGIGEVASALEPAMAALLAALESPRVTPE